MKKTAVITGGSRGIGRSMVLSFAQKGYNVVFCYEKNENAAFETEKEARKLGAKVYAFKADVSKSEEVEKLFAFAEEKFSGADVLICNAGIGRQKLFTDITDEDFDQMIGVNLKGVFYCCRRALPYMIRNKWGRIINITSMWGETGGSCEVDYSAAKAGVIGLTKALAKEVGPSGITVNAVSPGVIETDMNRAFTPEDMSALADETPLCRIGKPEEVAAAAVFLAGEEAGFITGQVLGVNGGIVI